MAEVVRLAKAENRPPQRSVHVKTETGDDIARSLDLMRQIEGPALTMIAGAPGVGKTLALRRFCLQEGNNALLVTVARGEGRPSNLAEVILDKFGVRTNGMSLPAMRAKLAAYVGPGRVLLLDEAQHLDKDGVEWVRAGAEESGFDLVLCGDLALSDLVDGIPQLQSRVVRPVLIRAAKRSDAAAIAADAGVTDLASIDALCGVARLKGGLRNVDNVLRLATLFAGGDLPSLAAIKAAVVDMKLHRMGDE